ncbi:MAG: hypothetical protein DLM52_02325 [Chthoniobacterales bacterium]|nr:MAG: hypothetical protein DLM52_02325 [Chthoniobacterales bacterium]
MNAAAAPLLFDWPAPEHRRRALVVFVVASLLLHAFCFYIFQIVYPPAVALLPPPARVSIISPDDPESVALLRWVEAEDPALATTTQRPSSYRRLALPELAHIPSYAQHKPALRTIPETAPDLSIPSSAAIGSMPRKRPLLALPLMTRKTSAVFAEGAKLGAPVFPDFTFRLSRPDAPANTRYRLAVDENGVVRFCFLATSSGDPQLDEQARQFLLLCRFPAREKPKPLLWSMATILWGNDFAPLENSKLAP